MPASAPVACDAQTYFIDGRPTWLLVGEIHYFKLTRGEWRRRLVQLKSAGFNAVAVYLPWNYHELAEGCWDFAGDRDVEHFLGLAAELGLYVVARPGPYICDEWLAGGLPPWLGTKPDLRPRTADPQYLGCVDRWFDRVAPLIARYQLGRAGSVILAQVENEYGHFGEAQEEAYILHLRDALRARGVTVPIITCDSFIKFPRLRPTRWPGINLGCNFGGDGLRILRRARELQADAPLFVTEYWVAAFDWWGRNGSAAADDRRALHGALEIAAGGAAGLTAFVFSGGAHFGYWHGRSICSAQNFMTTLYGPGAPVLDDGRFSPKYQLLKNRLAPLANPELAAAGMPGISGEEGGLLRATRRGPHATYEFFLNRGREQLRVGDQVKDQACVDMAIPAGAVQWQVANLPLPDGNTLVQSELALFASTPALVVYGPAGSQARLVFADGTLAVTVPAVGVEAPACYRQGRLPVLVLNDEAIARTWRLALPGLPIVLCGGPDRIEDWCRAGSRLQVAASAEVPRACWYLAGNEIRTLPAEFAAPPAAGLAPLTGLAFSPDLPERAPGFADESWFAAAQPQPLARFGHGQGWAWYRCRLTVRAGGPQHIHFSGALDRMHAWANGEYLGARGHGTNLGWSLMPNLPPGTHTLALLVENLGMFNSGAEFDVPSCEPKGLFGPVWLNGRELTGWRMRAGLAESETLDYWPGAGHGLAWQAVPDSVTGPAWWQARFACPEGFDGAARLELATAGKGSAWLNGHNLGRYWNLGPQQSLWLPLDWLRPDNELLLFEELGNRPVQVAASFAPFGHRTRLEMVF